jgi:SAM-dependent methyltransferase
MENLKIEKTKFIRKIRPPSAGFDRATKRIKYSMFRFLNRSALVLVIGAGERAIITSRKDIIFIKTDLIKGMGIDLVADAHDLPFDSSSFDAVICENVLEHVKNPKKVVSEIYRIIKKEGRVLFVAPFIQGYHADPNDYHRFTRDGYDLLFSNFKMIESGIASGPTASLIWITREYFSIYFNNIYLYKIVKFFISWLTFPLRYLDFFLENNKFAPRIACTFYYYLEK